MKKKYEILRETEKTFRDRRVYRIRALRNIKRDGVKKGQLGGYVEHERNLSHAGQCWIADEAVVVGKGGVTGDAVVGMRAVVVDANVSGDAFVWNDAYITNGARVSGGRVIGSASIEGPVRITGGFFSDCGPSRPTTSPELPFTASGSHLTRR